MRTADVPARMAPSTSPPAMRPVCEVFERAKPDLPQPLALHSEPLVVQPGNTSASNSCSATASTGASERSLLRRGHEPVDVDRDRRPETDAAAGPDVHQVGSGLAQPPPCRAEVGRRLVGVEP
jgi:hypothetical protein